jgi:hypothetical protein
MRLLSVAVPIALCWIDCSGGGGSSATVASATTSGSTSASPSPAASASATTSAYVGAYKSAAWQSSAVTVKVSGSCSLTLTTTGVPPYHNAYYLAPVSTEYPTAVAVTPVSGTEMSVIPYTPSAITSATVTLNTCPTKASSATSTNMGPIGYLISGEAIYNPYEGNGEEIPALSDNVSYTFTANGVSQTASFIDACSSHPTPLTVGYTWHHHGNPTCLAAQIDGTSGPSHLLGIALDGYPIYGGRDINGNVVSATQLDACNGITSPTPEFPNGAYHYVLPIGVTGKQSSLNCYTGVVSQAQLAAQSRYVCGLDALNRRLQAAARVARRRKTAYDASFERVRVERS